MKLKPADGRAVRDPVKGTLLPEEGAIVQVDKFWRKRLRDGDVLEVTEAAPAKATASTATTDGTTAEATS